MHPFPSLRIEAHALVPQGSFAESQAQYLNPEHQTVVDLNTLLSANNIGVVAHFYMDAELQGVLSRCQWPHIYVAFAVDGRPRRKNGWAGVSSIVVLGVDFMSENVRAVLDAAGHTEVPVYLFERELAAHSQNQQNTGLCCMA